MALTCPADLSGVSLPFTEFLDCATLSINYDILGTASLSFTVISVNSEPTPTNYTTLQFGGVTFTGYVSGLAIRRIAGTGVFEHAYNITAVGCR